jgi:hypothetical protein
MKHLRLAGLILAGLLLSAALIIHLDSVPALWWDEGWTLSVARNWAEYGHYGRFLAGHPTARGLEFGFPVTGAVALSFRLFGVGIFQARLVAVILTLATLVLFYQVTRRFYNRSIAVATLIVLISLGCRADINLLLMGRQVLGEMPSLMFLLAGYLCFLSAEKRIWLFMPVAICCWSLASLTKLQLRPFFTAALLLPLLLTLLQGRWRTARIFGAGLIGSLALHLFFDYLFERLWPTSAVSGLTPLIALVLSKETRLKVLISVLQFGMPTLLGLCWGFWTLLRVKKPPETHIELVRFSFLILSGSWFAWYVSLSLGWPRYAFPPVFLGSVFVAAMLDRWTSHFNLAQSIEQAGSVLRKLRFHPQSVCALVSIVLVVISLGQTSKVLYRAFVVESDNSIYDTIRFLNTATPPNALIETFESELLFLLDRRYHYPPDQVHVELIRRMHLPLLKIDYNPLAANPDYLVVGHQGKYWNLYDPYLTPTNFRSLQKYSRYEIFERVR